MHDLALKMYLNFLRVATPRPPGRDEPGALPPNAGAPPLILGWLQYCVRDNHQVTLYLI